MWLQRQSYVKRHKLSVHEGVKYKWDECEYRSTKSNYVSVHKLAVHEGVRYKCNEYDYQSWSVLITQRINIDMKNKLDNCNKMMNTSWAELSQTQISLAGVLFGLAGTVCGTKLIQTRMF